MWVTDCLQLADWQAMVNAQCCMLRGLLIRGGDILEAAAGVNVVAFDKTGTLTVGKPSIEGVSVRAEGQAGRAEQPSRQLLAYAAALERQSTHPLAHAVLSAAAAAGVPGLSPWSLGGRVAVASSMGGRHCSLPNPCLLLLCEAL